MEQPQAWCRSRTSTVEVAAVLPTTSQPLATPSFSEPPTELTESNCGRFHPDDLGYGVSNGAIFSEFTHWSCICDPYIWVIINALHELNIYKNSCKLYTSVKNLTLPYYLSEYVFTDYSQGSMLKPMCTKLVFLRAFSGCYLSLPS